MRSGAGPAAHGPLDLDHRCGGIRPATRPLVQVVPIHDFYLSASGRSFIMGMAERVLDQYGIEVVPLDWGQSYTL